MRPTLSLFKGRSAWKGPYFVAFSNLKEASQRNVAIKTQARACTILPNFVGIRFLVHNGKQYLPVLVTQDMVGHKLGEFSHTRKNNPTKQKMTKESKRR
ncbi:mitochondrial 30S ribosomal protein S19 [Armillaria borealis]|uniref:Small ribosomal subunit protein uS19m n=1 Tax=Armillaria borealis TaxID=47425 RepID=A0AA39IBM0_9AGAR|nr:mitochondrial 30S ribosomal protein S19 [Armillaria mellea]KAK0421435.1 mitochondrial 30S ribosomal protein S19 [Armillaria borealis]